MSRNPAFTKHGLVSRRKPQVTPDGGANNEVADRNGRYGEGYVLPLWPTDQLLADEGSYYVSALAPGATALQLGLSAAFAASAVALAFQNTESAQFDGGARCYPRYLKFVASVAPTSGTALRFASVLDAGARNPTTVVLLGGAAATATCYKALVAATSLDQAEGGKGQPYFPLSTAAGAPPAVAAASQNARTIVGNGSLRAQIPVVGDEYVIQFGMADHPAGSLVTAAPAGASRIVAFHPPIVIPPQAWWLFYLWAPGNITAGLAFDAFEVGWAER